MSHLFYMQHRVGDLVDVAPVTRRGRPNSEGGRGYIKRRSSSPTSVTSSYDVEYIIPKKKISLEVTSDRLSPATIETVARRRRPASDDVPIQPSLLSTHHQAAQKLMSIRPSPPKRPRNLIKITTAVLLNQSRTWNGDGNHPILGYLQRNSNKDKGYLRRNDATAAGVDPSEFKLKSHLSKEEKNNILQLRSELRNVVEFKSNSVTQLIADAYGVGKRSIQDWEKKGTDQSRKQRSDAGTNLLTSATLQENWFSPLQCFKKSQRRSTIANTLLDTGADADNTNFKEQWDAMSSEDQKPYIQMSKSLKTRAPFLIGEIQQALHRTGGSCTWRQLETHLASSDGIPVISYQQIRRLVMGLEDSQYTSTKLLPALTTAHIIKRKIWCQQFWIFWDSSRKFIRKRILLVHMDEKWFYGIVVRMKNKLIPFLGMDKAYTAQHTVHHKNYKNKTMGLVSSGYLPDDNNIEAGGRGFHGSAIRAGHMIECKTTTYRRQTDANGKITYPKTAGNENRIAGRLYFESCEVTANTREKRGKRKFSLQHDFWPVEFNYWERLCRQLTYETGQDVVVLYQWDGAGPHAKKELVVWLLGEFRDRGWIWRMQASQSPHLQVHDTSIFPSLSKWVSMLQGLGNGSRVVDNDELWDLVQEAYYNRLTPQTIARAFAHHVQIVNAMYSCNGGDEYHRNGGLHCGVRKAYAPLYKLVDGEPIGDPIGVQLIESADEETKTLRYARPSPEELDLDWTTGLFNRSQLEFLVNNLPEDSAVMLQAEEALHGLESRE